MRVYVPLMLRPWVMDRTHKETVHLGEKVTFAMLERYYYWVGMASSVKWGIRRCYACQARKKTRYTVRWPLVSLRQPGSQDNERYGTTTFSISAPPFWPRPDGRIRSTGNEHVFLIVYLFGRHTEEYALSADEKTTQGCAAKLVHDYIPRWGCSHTFLSDRGPEFRVQGLPRNLPHAWGREEIYQQRSRTDQQQVGAAESHTVPDAVPSHCGKPDKLG